MLTGLSAFEAGDRSGLRVEGCDFQSLPRVLPIPRDESSPLTRPCAPAKRKVPGRPAVHPQGLAQCPIEGWLGKCAEWKTEDMGGPGAGLLSPFEGEEVSTRRSARGHAESSGGPRDSPGRRWSLLQQGPVQREKPGPYKTGCPWPPASPMSPPLPTSQHEMGTPGKSSEDNKCP